MAALAHSDAILYMLGALSRFYDCNDTLLRNELGDIMTRKQNWVNVGLLALRLGIGVSIFFHGLPKIMGGPDSWEAVGSAMSHLGIQFAPTFWGFMAAFAETIGGIALALGVFLRPAALLLATNMIVALVMHVSRGDGFLKYGHALDLLIVFAALFIIGPGKYSFDSKYFAKIA